MFKKREIEDERIASAHQRYNSEALGIMLWALLIDVFYRSVILRQDLMAYWDISLIFFGTSFYLTIRKVGSGIFAFEGMKKAWRTIIITSIISGLAMTATFYYLNAGRSPGELIVNFIIGTLTFGFTMSIFYYVSNRRADRQ